MSTIEIVVQVVCPWRSHKLPVWVEPGVRHLGYCDRCRRQFKAGVDAANTERAQRPVESQGPSTLRH